MAQPVSSKVLAGGVGGGAGVLFVWGWGLYMPEQPMPPEVGAGISTVCAVVGGWIKKEARLWREAIGGKGG